MAPIVLFAYKRPRHTLALLESLAANLEARRSHLTIYCDGPKDAGEADAVAEVRRVVRGRAWCGHVEVVERPTNLGLACSVIEGVTEALDRSEDVIVLEDDLVLSPCFLRYMNAALDRYRHEPEVMQVSGYMFPCRLPPALDACFLPMISSWGWATWARVWRHFDPAMSGFAALAQDEDARRRFDLEGSYPFFRLLEDQRAGRIDSWGVRWHLSVFERGGLTLFPARSYVRNLGWDGSGTHCAAGDFYDTELSTRAIDEFPQAVAVTESAYQAVQRYFRGQFDAKPAAPSLSRRVVNKLRSFLRRHGPSPLPPPTRQLAHAGQLSAGGEGQGEGGVGTATLLHPPHPRPLSPADDFSGGSLPLQGVGEGSECGSAPGALRGLQRLNLGCGDRLHADWVNVDARPARADVLRHDVLAAPLPFADETFAVVYHAHLLEHLPAERAPDFLRECRRLLRPGGILRVVVPDLEQIASMYVQSLERAWQGEGTAWERRDWLVLELFDQMTRDHSGGRMLAHLRELPASARAFVLGRLGADGPKLALAATAAADWGTGVPPASGGRQHARTTSAWRDRLRGWLFGSWRERLIRWLLGKEYALLQQARFRASGEVHRWMYDRVSLRAALEAAGFTEVRIVGPKESAVEGWAEFHLDTLPDGSITKPDSLFMEGRNDR